MPPIHLAPPPPAVAVVQDGSANGTYCEPSAIVGTLCVEMPGMKVLPGVQPEGCLCCNGTGPSLCVFLCARCSAHQAAVL